ncbi:MAG: hypothetical protein EBS38_06090 [Actinobacteria bacterium]|nr:hypothetical protein [Actinomycetota bacterium]
MASKTLKLPVGSWVVISAFTLSGVLHLINPQGFMFLMPQWAPEPILLIYLSGVAELASALGLLLRKNWGRYLTVATLLAIWPANWWFAINALNGELWLAIAAWLRLPLQIPLILWAWRNPVSR